MNFPQCVHIEDIPFIESRGASLKVYASPKTIGTSKLVMGCAVLRSGEEIHEHVHDYGEEVVLVVRGQGAAFVEEESYRVKEGSVFIARQGQRHRVVNDSGKELELLFCSAPLAPDKDKGHRDA